MRSIEGCYETAIQQRSQAPGDSKTHLLHKRRKGQANSYLYLSPTFPSTDNVRRPWEAVVVEAVMEVGPLSALPAFIPTVLHRFRAPNTASLGFPIVLEGVLTGADAWVCQVRAGVTSG